MSLEIIYLIYMYKKHVVLNILQWFMYHKKNPNEGWYAIKQKN